MRTLRSTRTTLAVLPLAVAFTLAGCADNTANTASGSGNTSGGTAQAVNVTITDDGCTVDTDSFPSGVVTFNITNNGSVPNEFEVLTENKLQIVSEQENIGPGSTMQMTTALEKGTYFSACKPNMVGELVGVTELTITQGEDVQVSDDVAALEAQAVANYTAYVKDQVGQLVTANAAFTQAYVSGDYDQARQLFPLARQYYERIEPTAEAFGLEEAGDLDAALDLRIQDIAADAGTKVTDPATIATWTGWHRIEADLWTEDDASPFKFASQSERQAAAEDLNQNVQKLYDLVYGNIDGASGAFKLSLTDVATGAADLLEEVALSKIVGEEDTFSHTDLYDFQANVEGAQVAYGNVQAIVEKNNPELAAEIEKRFTTVEDLLAAQESGTTKDGSTTYVDYSEIAAVQENAGEAPADSDYTDTQREFSNAVNALSESLSQVAGTVLH